MNTKLYKKLYLYNLIVLITSIFLTFSTIGLLFHFTQRNVFREHFVNEASFIKKILKEIYREHPKRFKSRLQELSYELKWSISYIKDKKIVYYVGNKPDLPSDEQVSILSKEQSMQILKRYTPHPQFIALVDESKPEKGYIILKFDNPFYDAPFILKPFFISGVLILLFLGLLLIPYSLYIIRPYNQLMTSIKQISEGDFSTVVEVKKQSEFTDLADAFNNMTYKIQEMIQEKQRLIADVSHELRSPLTRMRVGMEILQKDPEGRKKYIDKAILEIDNLNKMIQEILDISKLELDYSLELEKINFIEFIKSSLEDNQILFQEHNINVKTEFDSDEIFVEIDLKLMERVMNNIFSNTIKYSPKNSIVTIKLSKKTDLIIFTIKDQGEGVKKEDYEKIFEPFYRTDESRTRKTGGTGLGLAIVKKIINYHKGKVWVSSPDNGENGLVLNFQLNIMKDNLYKLDKKDINLSKI
jgi:signal transduction histidine kinase